MAGVRTHLDLAEAWALEHRTLLQRIADHWLDEGEWPSVEQIVFAVLRDSDEEVHETLRLLPAPLGRIGPRQGRTGVSDDAIELRVRALATVERARPLLDTFVRVIMLAATLLTQRTEPPYVLRDSDLEKTLSLPAGAAAKVAELVFIEGWMFHGGSGNADGSWERNLGERFLPVRKVHTLDAYLQVEGDRNWSIPAERSTLPAVTLTDEQVVGVKFTDPALTMSALHPSFAAKASALLTHHHFDEAVRAAVLALDELLRERSGLAQLEGKNLAGAVLGGTAPKIWLAPAQSRDRRAEQDGWRMLTEGCFAALRNPVAHRLVYDEITSAMEALATVSMIMRRIDEATRLAPST